MPRAPDLEEPLYGSPRRTASASSAQLAPGARRPCLVLPGGGATIAAIVFLCSEAVRLVAVRRADYGMQAHGIPHAHGIIQLASPVLRWLLLAPLLLLCSTLERRDAAAARVAALEQRIATNNVVSVPTAPCAVPWVAILALAILETSATYGLAAVTGASATADMAFAALAASWITVPVVIGLSMLLLRRFYRRSHAAAAALAAIGVAIGGACATSTAPFFCVAPLPPLTAALCAGVPAVVPQLHRLASSADGGSPSAVASSVSTAVGMVGPALALAAVYKEALLARPARPAASLVVPGSPPTQPNATLALMRFGLSLAVWEAFFAALLQAAMAPLVNSSEHVTLAELPAHVVNGTRCLMAVSSSQEESLEPPDSNCSGVGLVFAVFAVAEAGSRVAGYALIRSSSGGTFALVSTLLWPTMQLLSAWHLALGQAAVSPAWRYCEHGVDERACVTPLGPFDVASLTVCVAAVGLWCDSTRRMQGQVRRDDSGAATSSSSSSSSTAGAAAAAASYIEEGDDGAGAQEDDPSIDEIILEIVGLHRSGVYTLVVLIVLLVVSAVSLIVAWVEQVIHAIHCLLLRSSSDEVDRCSRREMFVYSGLALLPLVLVGGAVLLRWQMQRRGVQRRREACAAPGAMQATLHVYGPSSRFSPSHRDAAASSPCPWHSAPYHRLTLALSAGNRTL
jgi:hypothetical protein